jgi:hypothetical protein
MANYICEDLNSKSSLKKGYILIPKRIFVILSSDGLFFLDNGNVILFLSTFA